MSERAAVSNCRGCGKAILWAKVAGSGEDGEKAKWVPMDTAATIYELCKDGEESGYEVKLVPSPERKRTLSAGGMITAVSHFATCTKADRFSSSRRTGG